MDRRVTPDHGFSLIELMVAVAVLGVLSTSIVLGLGSGTQRTKPDAVRFQALVDELRAEAILSQQTVAVSLTQGGYQKPVAPNRDTQSSRPINAWVKPVVFNNPPAPKITLRFTPDGQLTPFEIRFETAICTGSRNGVVTCR